MTELIANNANRIGESRCDVDQLSLRTLPFNNLSKQVYVTSARRQKSHTIWKNETQWEMTMLKLSFFIVLKCSMLSCRQLQQQTKIDCTVSYICVLDLNHLILLDLRTGPVGCLQAWLKSVEHIGVAAYVYPCIKDIKMPLWAWNGSASPRFFRLVMFFCNETTCKDTNQETATIPRMKKHYHCVCVHVYTVYYEHSTHYSHVYIYIVYFQDTNCLSSIVSKWKHLESGVSLVRCSSM